MPASEFFHKSVLYEETLDALELKADGCYADGTVGGAGHSSGILKALGPKGRLHAFDRDQEALQAAERKLSEVKSEGRYFLHHSVYSKMDEVLKAAGEGPLDGLLLDLGVSSRQFDRAERGFSYRFDAPLDMRMDQSSGMSAADLLASVSEEELRRILREYGEEREAKRIARAIVREREAGRPVQTTKELADLILQVMPARSRRGKGHPAKRSFQALRIAVNAELDELDSFLEKVPALLAPGGKAAIITFHSLEDRRVKQAFRRFENPCTCPPQLPCVCGKKSLGKEEPRGGIRPSAEEVKDNPRAHSARLRVFRRNSEAEA